MINNFSELQLVFLIRFNSSKRRQTHNLALSVIAYNLSRRPANELVPVVDQSTRLRATMKDSEPKISSIKKE